jgi:hypothetical protein
MSLNYNLARSYSESSSTFNSNTQRPQEVQKRKVLVEIDNSQFFFLIKYNVCPNDENSRYYGASNKMHLVGKNGRQMVNGVIIGKIL